MADSTPGRTSPELATALIRGRISGKSRKFSTRDGSTLYETPVTLPAPDEWSSPSTLPIRSRERLGDIGETFTGKVRIAGTARPFTYTDKVSGEQRQGTDFSVWLSLATE